MCGRGATASEHLPHAAALTWPTAGRILRAAGGHLPGRPVPFESALRVTGVGPAGRAVRAPGHSSAPPGRTGVTGTRDRDVHYGQGRECRRPLVARLAVLKQVPAVEALHVDACGRTGVREGLSVRRSARGAGRSRGHRRAAGFGGCAGLLVVAHGRSPSAPSNDHPTTASEPAGSRAFRWGPKRGIAQL
jgi:hypothetical protein